MNCIVDFEIRGDYAREAGLGKFLTKNLVENGSGADRTLLYKNPCMFVIVAYGIETT